MDTFRALIINSLYDFTVEVEVRAYNEEDARRYFIAVYGADNVVCLE